MKSTKTLNVLLIAGLLSTAACNNTDSQKAGDMADSAQAKTENAMQDVKEGAQNMAANVKDAVNGNEDSNFVVKATIANNEEMKLIQAGIDNGTGKDMKAHAKMMMKDHKALAAKVSAWAATKNYPLPTTDNGNADDELANLNKNKKGTEWDMAWTSKMVDKHNDAISMFEKGQNNVKDADLKALITATLPTLHSHLDMMKQLQGK